MQELQKRYEKKEMIGHGNMAKVFKGYDHKLKRSVVVKVGEKNLIKRESLVMASLSGRYTTVALDYFVSDGKGSLVMLPIEGVSLSYYEKRSLLLPYEQLKPLVLDWCYGLKELHSAYYHADLASDQLWIGPNHRGILMDFGSAIPINCSDKQAIFAHLDTLAPEIKQGAIFTEKADIYSLCKSILGVVNSSDIYSKKLQGILLRNMSASPRSRQTLSDFIATVDNL